MPADFFPKREADIRDWSGNFRAQIEGPGMGAALGLSPEMISEYASLQQSFASLWQLSQSNSTRTPSIIQAKNDARIALEKYTRVLTRIVRTHPGVTMAQRTALGLPARNPGGPRGRRWTQSFPKVPEHSPRLGVVEVKGLRVRLRLRDRMSPMNASLPKGVHGATIFYATGDLPPALKDRNRWKFLCNTARTVFDVAFEGRRGFSGRGGKMRGMGPALPPFTRVWFTAVWIGRSTHRSAWCEPVYTHLGYGLALAA